MKETDLIYNFLKNGLSKKKAAFEAQTVVKKTNNIALFSRLKKKVARFKG